MTTSKVKPQSKFAEANGLRLHYNEWSTQGTPLVFLHGITGSSNSWDAIAPSFVDDYRVMAFDLRGHGQSGKGDALARARRLIHLAEDHGRIIEDVGLDQFRQKVVAFAGAFANAGKNRITTVARGDIVDQLFKHHRLADAGTTEEPQFATACEGTD